MYSYFHSEEVVTFKMPSQGKAMQGQMDIMGRLAHPLSLSCLIAVGLALKNYKSQKDRGVKKSPEHLHL